MSEQNDILGVLDVLDDQRRRIELLERVIVGVRRALGEDGLHCQLLALGDLVAAKVTVSEKGRA